MRAGPVKGFAMALLLASLAGVAKSDDSSPFGSYFQNSQCSTPYALAANSDNLQTLAAAIKAAGLVNLLDSTSSAITVFAPTDDAFAALASALSMTSEELLSKSDLLSVILEYHVYAKDAYKVSDFTKHSTLVTAEGETLAVKTVGDIVTVVPTAGSTATVLVSDMSACKAYVQIVDTVLIPQAAATTLGMTTVDAPGAAQTETQAVQSLVSKKTTAATPVAAVPVETILVPATPVATTPAVAVSGVRLVASPEPTPVATILAPTTPTTTPMAILQGHSLVNNVLLKKTLNTFSTPVPTPEETPAPSVPTLKELLLKETPAATEAVITPTKETLHDLLMKETPAAVPLETVVVPAATTVPAVAVSGARIVPSPAVVPTPTAVAVPVVVPVVEASPPMQDKLIDQLVQKKTLNTFTPVATEEATPAPSVPALKQLLLKETPAATEMVKTPLIDLLQKETPAATPIQTILVPATPAATAPAVPVSGARLVVASPEVVPAVEVPVTTNAAQSPVVAVLTPIRDAVAPAIARVGSTISTDVQQRSAAVAPARAAVAQAAAAVVDDRRAMLSPITAGATPVVVALDGPDVGPVDMLEAMAPGMMAMAPMTAPVSAMAPSVQALAGPDMMMMMSSTPMMAPASAPMAAMAPAVQALAGPTPMMMGSAPMMAPMTAPMAAMAPSVAALAGPNTMSTAAMAPGMAPTTAPASAVAPEMARSTS